MMKINFVEPDQPRSGAAVVGVWEDGVLTPSARRLDEAAGGAISRAVAAAPRFKGKKDELLPILGAPNLSLSRIVLAGLGKPESIDARSLQQLGGRLYAHLSGAGEEEATFAIEVGDASKIDQPQAAAEMALGAQLRSYRFDKYKTKEKLDKKPTLSRLTVMTAAAAEAQRAYRPLEDTADAVFSTRDLVS
ncbi:MAG TPA: M17 family peptidase N-terminal domain-containing protein, partial [Stellaceae bacterium]|nr:M17 family peptidase N-terminal domain-containing protein [Stellaceae bacterium]